MNKVLGNEHVTRDGVCLDPSHNNVGQDTNRWSSHNDVGRLHSAGKEEKKRAVRYAVAKVWEEIVSRYTVGPLCFVESTQDVVRIYTTATDDEHAKMEYLVGDFKPTNVTSDNV
jgi:hypothetical protein